MAFNSCGQISACEYSPECKVPSKEQKISALPANLPYKPLNSSLLLCKYYINYIAFTI